MKVMIAVVVTDRRKVSEQDKATAAPVDSECESDEHLSWGKKTAATKYIICDPILENHPFGHMQNLQENSIEDFSNIF